MFDIAVNGQGMPANWTVRGPDQAVGETPIPGTALLLAGGQAALGGLRRRAHPTHPRTRGLGYDAAHPGRSRQRPAGPTQDERGECTAGATP